MGLARQQIWISLKPTWHVSLSKALPLKVIHRPGPYGNSLSGVSYDRGGHGYEPPKYDHAYGYKPPTEATNPLKDLQIQQ